MKALLAALLAVTLAWQDNSDNEQGFKIYRQLPGAAFEVIGTTGADVTTFTDPNPVNGGCYKVTAFIVPVESEFSNTVCLPLPPAAPSNLRFQ